MLAGAYLTLFGGIQVRCRGTFDAVRPWFWLQVMLELRKLDGTAKEVT